MATSRQLTAIMFTDIVGYTALMGSDEKKSFEILRKNRRIHWRLIKKFRGRMLKEMGDGNLASFPSNIDAVLCALAIQHAAKELDIPLRIGIHQGDVIFERRDVLGDGVNIASRIQGIANTNSIVISEVVYNNIKNKKGIEFQFLETKILKGVSSAIGIYSVSCPDISLLDFTVDTGELIRPLSTRKTPYIVGIIVVALVAIVLYFLPRTAQAGTGIGRSLIILPFDNYTGSADLDYFVSGMHDELISNMGRIGALRVLSKTTANAYKNVEKSIPEIAAELNVDAVIEASVSCLGDSICVQLKLVSAYPEEEQLWVQDYYWEESQVLNLYKQITQEISKEINVVLTPQEESILTESKTVDPEAYKYYMNGKFYSEIIPTAENQQIALKYFERSIEIDSTFAPAYGGICWVWISLLQIGASAPSEAIPKIYAYNQKALYLDPNYPEAQYHKAVISFQSEWDWGKSEAAFRKGIELNPNIGMMHSHFGHLLMYQQRFDEAIEQVEQGLRIDPLNPHVQGLAAVVYWGDGQFDKALEITSIGSEIFAKNAIEESIAYMEGKYELSIDLLNEQWGADSLLFQEVRDEYSTNGYKACMHALAENMEKKLGSTSNVFLAFLYNRAGMTDDAIRILEN